MCFFNCNIPSLRPHVTQCERYSGAVHPQERRVWRKTFACAKVGSNITRLANAVADSRYRFNSIGLSWIGFDLIRVIRYVNSIDINSLLNITLPNTARSTITLSYSSPPPLPSLSFPFSSPFYPIPVIIYTPPNPPIPRPTGTRPPTSQTRATNSKNYIQ